LHHAEDAHAEHPDDDKQAQVADQDWPSVSGDPVAQAIEESFGRGLSLSMNAVHMGTLAHHMNDVNIGGV
jgi:hypothetical protein